MVQMEEFDCGKGCSQSVQLWMHVRAFCCSRWWGQLIGCRRKPPLLPKSARSGAPISARNFLKRWGF